MFLLLPLLSRHSIEFQLSLFPLNRQSPLATRPSNLLKQLSCDHWVYTFTLFQCLRSLVPVVFLPVTFHSQSSREWTNISPISSGDNFRGNNSTALSLMHESARSTLHLEVFTDEPVILQSETTTPLLCVSSSTGCLGVSRDTMSHYLLLFVYE